MSDWQATFPWTASVVRTLWPAAPARRWRWVVLALGVLLLVALHASLTAVAAARAARAERAFVARWGELAPGRFAPAPVEDRDNKARVVRAATELMTIERPRGSGAKGFEEYGTSRREPFSAAERDAVRATVEANRVALDLLAQAVPRPRSSWNLRYERGIAVDVPPLLRIVQLAKLNAAAGRLALEDGRIDEALLAVERGTQLGASLAEDPVLIVQHVRLAGDAIVTALARRIVGRGGLTAAQLARLDAALPRLEPRRGMQRAMLFETVALARALGDPDAELEHRQVALGAARALWRPALHDDARLWLAIMGARSAALDAPRHARVPLVTPEPRIWNVVLRTVLFDEAATITRADLAECRGAAARVALAVERHRVERGRTPAALDALVPDYLDAEPLDPLTGAPFVYETDGSSWSVRSAADWRSLPGAPPADPVIEWRRPTIDA